MNLQCPSCKSDDTQKLSMVMTKSGLLGLILRFGAVYVYNIWIPVATLFFGFLFAVVFALWNAFFGFLVFVGFLAAGFFARKWVKAKTISKFADVPSPMKENGFQCQRCSHLFIPAI